MYHKYYVYMYHVNTVTEGDYFSVHCFVKFHSIVLGPAGSNFNKN